MTMLNFTMMRYGDSPARVLLKSESQLSSTRIDSHFCHENMYCRWSVAEYYYIKHTVALNII